MVENAAIGGLFNHTLTSIMFGIKSSIRCYVVLGSVLFALALADLAFADTADAARQAEIAQRGAKVMPFSLEKTQHQFTKSESGGIQRVIARDAEDQVQIQLIRQHLEQLAAHFNRGDYSGPESIHGMDMPGLAQLKEAKPGSLRITYEPEAAGASLTFDSNDQQLIKAVHLYFDAQLHDHGHDAMEMHRHHHP